MQPNDPLPSSDREVSVKEVLEAIPPGRTTHVNELALLRSNVNSRVYYALEWPVLNLHCDTDSCAGVRLFEGPSEVNFGSDDGKNIFVTFTCRNCKRTTKTYALGVFSDKAKSPPQRSLGGNVYKYGELPPFGPPTPARVITLLGPEKDYYLKGRRAENQGMGIAAFAYYRRVVENQKNRLLDEIIRVATKIGASPEMLADLSEAKNETQFTKAVESVKHGIPSGLLIDGHNPLTLLHSALSEGLHAQTDDECLEVATAIRVVLADLADRLGHALKDRAELGAALTKLMNRP